MRKIILISCVSKKLPHKASARHLYISPQFKKNLAYAQRLDPDAIFVLSAKYGLVDLDQEIEPYDLTLNTMSTDRIKVWAVRIDSIIRKGRFEPGSLRFPGRDEV
jgi:hypothetical protein